MATASLVPVRLKPRPLWLAELGPQQLLKNRHFRNAIDEAPVLTKPWDLNLPKAQRSKTLVVSAKPALTVSAWSIVLDLEAMPPPSNTVSGFDSSSSSETPSAPRKPPSTRPGREKVSAAERV